MASPQLENGYTRIANELLEALYCAPLNAGELKLILCVARASYGWGQKDAPISIREFAQRLRKHYAHVKRTARALIARGILQRNGSRIMVVKDYDKWRPALVPGTKVGPRNQDCSQGGTKLGPMMGPKLVPTLSLNLTSSQSPQAQKENTKEITKEDITCDSVPAGSGVHQDRPRRGGRIPDVKVAIETYIQTFREQFGKDPVIPWAKYGAISKQLLAGRPVQEVVRMIRSFISNPPEYYERRRLYGLEHVLAAAPTLLARLAEEDEWTR